MNIDSENSFNRLESDFKSIINFKDIKFDKDISKGKIKGSIKLSSSQVELLFKEVSNGYLKRYLDYGNPRESDLLLISPYTRNITFYYHNDTKELSITIDTNI